MNLQNFFKSKRKKQHSAILQILDGENIPWDHPNVIFLASEIVSKCGAVLEETSKFTLGFSEKRLPYSKIEIQKAIEILLRFLNNQNSWDNLIEKYNDLAKKIITNEFYRALSIGYMELSKFLPDEEGIICERASRLLAESRHQGKSTEDIIREIKAPWFEKSLQIGKKITENSSLRLKFLQDNFGKEDVLFAK